MEAFDYFDPVGIKWREVIYKNKERLKQLKEMYEAKGHKAWIFPYDDVKWSLSVQFVGGK